MKEAIKVLYEPIPTPSDEEANEVMDQLLMEVNYENAMEERLLNLQLPNVPRDQ